MKFIRFLGDFFKRKFLLFFDVVNLKTRTENKNNEDGKETEITYKQFLESQIKKSIETLRKKETEKKLQKPLTKKNEEEML